MHNKFEIWRKEGTIISRTMTKEGTSNDSREFIRVRFFNSFSLLELKTWEILYIKEDVIKNHSCWLYQLG